MIDQTVEDLTPIIGTRSACRALGASMATVYRRRPTVGAAGAEAPGRRPPGRCLI